MAASDHDPDLAQQQLVRLLRLAYSGERGAAIAYAGHARALRDPVEKADLLRIEADERDHRERIGGMLADVGVPTSRYLEVRSRLVGEIIARFCAFGGWFCPMYGAGHLERRNLVEYENAARAAVRSGHESFSGD